jgi:DNA-binding NarL/FixJ family response regulator
VRARILVAGGRRIVEELTGDDVEIVGNVRSLADAEAALRALQPSVLVLDAALTERDGFCSLPALRRASPDTAIVLPPADSAGPRLVRAARLATRRPVRRRDGDGLTSRERDVVRLFALGHTTGEIADRLVLSPRTVEKHRARIRDRLGLSSRAELVRWARDRGLLSP